jgi:serine/threonine-protein kinase
MATVWRGLDVHLDRPVAVKILDPARAADPVALERLRREARTVARLDHPNIVGVHDFGIDGEAAYLVMELVDGQSLAGMLAADGPLPVGRAVAIADQACAALAAAHAAGVVHRDIKPGNLLVDSGETVKVCDFGIARLQARGGLPPLTATDAVVGTCEYMAPEQATGKTVDARCDLYALGCVLYAMLSGGPPFAAENPMAVLHQHLHDQPVSLGALRTGVPPELDRLASDLLAKDPADRPATAGQVHERLAEIADGSPAAGTEMAGWEGAGPAAAPPEARIPVVTLPAATRPGPATAPDDALPPEGLPPEGLPPEGLPPEGLPPEGLPPEGLPPGSGPGTDKTHRQRWAPHRLRRWGRDRAAAVAAALLAVAALLTPLPWAGRPEAGAQAPPLRLPSEATGTAPASPAAPAPTPSPSAPSPPTPSPATRLTPTARLAAAIPQQVEAGALDPVAGRDLLRELEEIDRRLTGGETSKADEKRAKLIRKLADLHRDGKLTAAGYDALRSLDLFLASAVSSGGG